MMPLRFGPFRTTPFTFTAPESGARNPAMMFNSVVLPQPDGPTMATNSPSPMVKSTPATTGSGPFSVGKLFLTLLTTILTGIAPPDRLDPFQAAHRAVEQQPGDADDDHRGHDQIVTVAGIARVDDQVTKARPEGDHLGRDDDQPCDAEADA